MSLDVNAPRTQFPSVGPQSDVTSTIEIADEAAVLLLDLGIDSGGDELIPDSPVVSRTDTWMLSSGDVGAEPSSFPAHDANNIMTAEQSRILRIPLGRCDAPSRFRTSA